MIRALDVKPERHEYGQWVYENTQRQYKTRIKEKRLSPAV